MHTELGPVEPGLITTAPEELELDDELDELDDELVEYHHDEPEELDELDDELVENHHCASQTVAVIPIRKRDATDNINIFPKIFFCMNTSLHFEV